MGSSSEVKEFPQNSVIFFDGICNLCNGAIQFIIKHDLNHHFKFTPIQSGVAKKYLTIDNTSQLNTIFLYDKGKLYEKSTAVLMIAKKLEAPWSWLYGFIYIPRIVRDAVYMLISKSRYRVFGKKDHCMIPTPDLQNRFI